MKLFDVNLEGAIISALMIEEDTKTLIQYCQTLTKSVKT